MEATLITYHRVLPRDLFNEAKLLKCLGRLTLLIHDRCAHTEHLSYEFNSIEHFEVKLLNDGTLFVSNFKLLMKNTHLFVGSSQNDKSSYPLFLITQDNEYIPVFQESGMFTEDIITFITNF